MTNNRITAESATYSQGVTHTHVHNLNDKKVRVCIRRDSYMNQSYACVEMWTDQHGWVLIHNAEDLADLAVVPSHTKDFHATIRNQGFTADDVFASFVSDLLHIAKQII